MTLFNTNLSIVWAVTYVARLFGTNGIRGVFGDDLNLGLVHDVSLCLADFFGTGPVLVGYDGRDSSPMIADMVTAALNFAGIDCDLAGLVPTPALEHAVDALDYAGGVMVTASHNPPEYNGIKVVGSNGVEISREDERKIEATYFEKRWGGHAGKFGSTGRATNVLDLYRDDISMRVDAGRIRERGFKIVVDCGNGAQSVIAPAIFSSLGCQVTTINGDIDGMFGGRGPEPTPENLDGLSKAVVRDGADLGVAFDGDGDRSLICDETGAILTGDTSAILLSKFLCTRYPNSRIVTCINSGNAIDKIAGQVGAQVIRTRVGSVEVSQRMVQEDALIGFEENGGFMYGPHNQVRDGVMTASLVLDILANTQKSLSELVARLPESHTAKTKVPCTADAARNLIAALHSEYPDADTTDGIRIRLDDDQWVMIRPSGTEPIVRIYAEGSSDESLRDIMGRFTGKVESALGGS